MRILMLLIAVALLSKFIQTFVRNTVHTFEAVLASGLKSEWRLVHAVGSGEALVRPARSIESIKLLRQSAAASFAIDPDFFSGVAPSEHNFIKQRLIEGAWPIEVIETSKLVVTAKESALAQKCKLVASSAEVALVDCDR